MRAFLCLALLVGCSADPEPVTRNAPEDVVYVTGEPLAWVTRRLVGDAVPVNCPVPEGTDPMHWGPEREALAAMQRAKLILFHGAGYESWSGGVSLPASRTVDTSEGLELVGRESVTHSHGLDGEHSHGEVDPSPWLEPGLLARQAGAAHRALVATWPEHQATFDAGLAALGAELEALASDLVATAANTPLLGASPAYEYLNQGSLDVRAFDVDPSEPSAGALVKLEAAQSARKATILLWPVEPAPEVAAKLEEHLGLTSVVFEIPSQGNYLEKQRASLARLRAALE